jgi:hypothetical protein
MSKSQWKDELVNEMIREVQRRTGDADGFLSILVLKEVMHETLDRFEDWCVEMPERIFPDDPKQQLALHDEQRKCFATLRAFIDENEP